MLLLDPLSDPRWDDLVSRHPRASVFHTRGWLDALRRTYGYQVSALALGDDARLRAGIVYARVVSFFSRRLVSLPFSDHCEPLADEGPDLDELLGRLAAEAERTGCRSVDLRPRASSSLGQGYDLTALFHLHSLDLRRPPEEIFAGFHPSHTQRAIRRAEREGLGYEAGRSEEQLDAFYGLLRLARRRHGLPAQPRAWFRNLAQSLGDALTVHLARSGGRPVAGILTLRFRNQLVYKYGGSDAAHHSLGGMPFLFWRAIQGARADGFEELDLGRSDLDQPGLVAFKEHLGASCSTLAYYAWPKRHGGGHVAEGLSRAARALVPHLPDWALDLAGRVVYKHFG